MQSCIGGGVRLMDFDSKKVLTGDEPGGCNVERSAVMSIRHHGSSHCGIADRARGHVPTIDLNAVEIENSAIVDDGTESRQCERGVSVELKCAAKIIGV